MYRDCREPFIPPAPLPSSLLIRNVAVITRVNPMLPERTDNSIKDRTTHGLRNACKRCLFQPRNQSYEGAQTCCLSYMTAHSRSCLPLLDTDAVLLVGPTGMPPGAGRPLKDVLEPRPGGGPDPPRPKPELALALGSVDDCPGLLPG